MRKQAFVFCLVGLSAVGCSPSAGDPPSTTSIGELTTTSIPATAPTTSSPTMASTTSSPMVASTTTLRIEFPSTDSFDVAVGPDGVTFEEDGAPPSGPSSFTIMSDGSVVIADSMAVGRGEPRLLHFDRTGEPIGTIDLAQQEVVSIVDVASDGDRLAVLDVFVAMNRYRVLILSTDGGLIDVFEVPDGFHLEDGLTGLEWDDEGPLLSFEFGARYARIAPGADPRPEQVLILEGLEVEITRGEGRVAEVRVEDSTFRVERATDLGGINLIGLAPDRTLALVVDEVDPDADTIEVTRRLLRYTPSGELLAETAFAAGQQYVAISHPLEMAADGEIFYMRSTPSGVTFVPESDLD